MGVLWIYIQFEGQWASTTQDEKLDMMAQNLKVPCLLRCLDWALAVLLPKSSQLSIQR